MTRERAHLEKGRQALDKIIMQQLGRGSNVRNRLATLDGQLKQQMNRIIEHRSDGLTFHHQAVSQVEQDGRQIVEQSMGGVVQGSLNELGVRQAASGRRYKPNGIIRNRISNNSDGKFASG